MEQFIFGESENSENAQQAECNDYDYIMIILAYILLSTLPLTQIHHIYAILISRHINRFLQTLSPIFLHLLPSLDWVWLQPPVTIKDEWIELMECY